MGAYGSPDLGSFSGNGGVDEKNMIYCQHCGTRYSKKVRKCPQCGKKCTRPFYNRWWFWVLVALVIFAVYPSKTQDNSAYNQNNDTQPISREEYISACKTYSYEDISRNPTQYSGKNAVFSGKVVQVQEDGNFVVLRMNVTRNQSGLYDDSVYIEYRRKSEAEPRILEDDMVNAYGILCGIKTYKSVLGNAVSIPYMKAEYVEAAQ